MSELFSNETILYNQLIRQLIWKRRNSLSIQWYFIILNRSCLLDLFDFTTPFTTFFTHIETSPFGTIGLWTKRVCVLQPQCGHSQFYRSLAILMPLYLVKERNACFNNISVTTLLNIFLWLSRKYIAKTLYLLRWVYIIPTLNLTFIFSVKALFSRVM